MLDVIKQLNLSSFCNIMYHAARETATEEAFKKKLEKEVTEEWLQHVNTTARLYGDQLSSYIDKQFIHCKYCGNVIFKEDKYCQHCGKKMGSDAQF